MGLEDVIGIKGIVVARPEDAINKDIATGEIDVEVNEIVVIMNQSLLLLISMIETLPWKIIDWVSLS